MYADNASTGNKVMNHTPPPSPLALRPCPMCGCSNVTVKMRDHFPNVDCSDCDMTTKFYIKDLSIEGAVKKYNTRAIDSLPIDELAKVMYEDVYPYSKWDAKKLYEETFDRSEKFTVHFIKTAQSVRDWLVKMGEG